MRRKQLRKSVAVIGDSVLRALAERWLTVLSAAGVDLSIRPEDLAMEYWYALEQASSSIGQTAAISRN
jgi:hypothetical protein